MLIVTVSDVELRIKVWCFGGASKPVQVNCFVVKEIICDENLIGCLPLIEDLPFSSVFFSFLTVCYPLYLLFANSNIMHI